MSELHIHSVPENDDYLAAALQLSGDAQQYGGMQGYLRDYEFRAVHNGSQKIHSHIRLAGEIALRLEPKNEMGIAHDRMSLGITHAFKRGLITGTKLTDIVHDKLLPDVQVLQRLNAGVSEQIVYDEDRFVDGLGMLTWGRIGVELVGDDTASYLDDMADDVSENPAHRELYKAGVGAAILTAYCLVVDQNLTSVERYFDQNDVSKELRELIDSTTGE